jgi:alpha-beta hydrolase superfamily lysophospholipase
MDVEPVRASEKQEDRIVTHLGQGNYSVLDRPEIVSSVFHPRPDFSPQAPEGAEDLFIPVEEDVSLMARAHQGPKDGASILFFHGNGEIVSDYDQLGGIYTQMGMTFIPVDYRGYGQSSGSPSISAMMRDSHAVFDVVRDWLRERGHHGSLLVMGRSLGSAPALELAGSRQEEFRALILESGFAYTMPLLRLLGIEAQALGLSEDQGMDNLDKMSRVRLPCLILHAQLDQIIPVSDAKALYQACPATEKTLVQIPGAGHNDIFLRDLNRYMQAIRDLVDKVL